MRVIRGIAGRIRRGDRIPAPIALALSVCTPAVRVGMGLRKLRRVHRVDARVISFGNITAGGTGKTPAVIERALAEIAAGHRVAVLTRGYAAPSGARPADSTDLRGESAYEALGDEAALILQKVAGVIVIKNADRVAGARRAIDHHQCDVLLLDDGFQYLRLARDEDVVLIDATKPFGNGHLLPRGILREPPTALGRATHVIVTHADAAADLHELDARIRELAPHAPIRHTRHAPVALRNLATGERVPLEWLRGQTLSVACAIAEPGRFMKTIEHLGARIEKAATAPDHAPIEPALSLLSGTIIITEKDAARLSSPQSNDTYAMEIELKDCS